MAIASIACTGLTTEYFDRMRGGPLPQFEETYQEITRPNIDGVAYKLFGQRAPVWQYFGMVGVSNGSWTLSAVDSLFTAYAAFVNTTNLATFSDETGTAYSNVRILRVDPWIQDTGLPYKLIAAQTGLTAKSLANPLICVYSMWLMQRAA